MRIDIQDAIKRLDALCICVAAVDIGAEGGIVMNKHKTLEFYDMPTPKHEWIVLNQGPSRIWAEDVHTFPGQGVVSMGSLMQRKGRLEGMAFAMGAKVNWIQPLKWIECFTLKRSKHFGTKKAWKYHLLEVAKDIHPYSELDLKTADAFLIWVYAAYRELETSLTKL